MKKIALFVEGQTEQIFTEKLIREFIGKHKFHIAKGKFSGGKKGPRKLLCMPARHIEKDTEYYFMIYNCEGDSRIKSDISNRLDTLREESFSLVIGIRDVYPETDIEKINHYLYRGISPMPNVSVKIVLAVMEIESWFLAEETHYSNISKRISLDIVNKIAGIDVSKDTTESIEHPSDILNRIYTEYGETYYNKSKDNVQQVVKALDYKNLCLNVRNRNKSLNELLTCLDGLIP